MRASLIVAILTAALSWGTGQSVRDQVPTSDSLHAASDLVVVAQLVGTRGTGRRGPHPARPDLPGLELESQFVVLEVLKGDGPATPAGARIAMRHFRVDVNQWRADHPGDAVPPDLADVGQPVRFLAGRGPYRVFLIRRDGVWEPASGPARASSSVVAVKGRMTPETSGRGPAPGSTPGMTRTSSASRSSTEPVSPVAWATWLVRGESPESRQLEVIVIWRGAPGWFARGTGQRSSSSSSARGHVTTLTFGDVTLEFELEYATRTAVIQGAKVEIGDANLILVDGVDEPGGGRVAEMRRIDTAPLEWNSGRPVLTTVLRRHADLVAFLRCDAPMPGGRAQASVDILCARLIGR
jgi:hypothetical protein